MKADRLIELIEDAGHEPQSYSGRCMYGRRCVGVTVGPDAMLGLGAALAASAVGGLDYEREDAEALYDAVDREATQVERLMRDARWDNMGRDYIVYWPDVEWPSDKEEGGDA